MSLDRSIKNTDGNLAAYVTVELAGREFKYLGGIYFKHQDYGVFKDLSTGDRFMIDEREFDIHEVDLDEYLGEDITIHSEKYAQCYENIFKKKSLSLLDEGIVIPIKTDVFAGVEAYHLNRLSGFDKDTGEFIFFATEEAKEKRMTLEDLLKLTGEPCVVEFLELVAEIGEFDLPFREFAEGTGRPSRQGFLVKTDLYRGDTAADVRLLIQEVFSLDRAQNVKNGKALIVNQLTDEYAEYFGNRIAMALRQNVRNPEYEHVCGDLVGFVKKVKDGKGNIGRLNYLLDGVSASFGISSLISVFVESIHELGTTDIDKIMRHVEKKLEEMGYDLSKFSREYYSRRLPRSTLVTAFERGPNLDVTSVGDSFVLHFDRDGKIVQCIGGETSSYHTFAKSLSMLKNESQLEGALGLYLREMHGLTASIGIDPLDDFRDNPSWFRTSSAEIEEGDILVMVSDWPEKKFEDVFDLSKWANVAEYLEFNAINSNLFSNRFTGELIMFPDGKHVFNGFTLGRFVEEVGDVIFSSKTYDEVPKMIVRRFDVKRGTQDDMAILVRTF